MVALVIIGMVKELLADMKRYKTDKISNSMPTHLVTGRMLNDGKDDNKSSQNVR